MISVHDHGNCELCDAQEARLARLEAALDRDKTGLAAALAEIVKEARAARWITDGRGSYAWDDHRYRQETGWFCERVAKIAEVALRASGALANAALEGRDE